MNYETLKNYEGKFCLVVLNNRFSYLGVIKKVAEDSITIFDKYHTLVSVDNSQVQVIIEKGESE